MTARVRLDLEQDARSIVATRVFDPPREFVFEAWSDPRHLAQWWGPDGFTTTTQAFEMRPGGIWRFVVIKEYGADKGAVQTLSRLGDYLVKMAPSIAQKNAGASGA
jgi:uncharacterized protein YndB with AHSA1/START domain